MIKPARTRCLIGTTDLKSVQMLGMGCLMFRATHGNPLRCAATRISLNFLGEFVLLNNIPVKKLQTP